MVSSYNFFSTSQSSDFNMQINAIRAFYDSRDEDAIIYSGNGDDNNCAGTNNGTIRCNSFIRYSGENKIFAYSSGQIYIDNRKTKGFRPVLTINLNVDGDYLIPGSNNNIPNNTFIENGTNQNINSAVSVIIDATIPSRFADDNLNQSEDDDVSNNYISNSFNKNNSLLNTDSKVEIIKENKALEKMLLIKQWCMSVVWYFS